MHVQLESSDSQLGLAGACDMQMIRLIFLLFAALGGSLQAANWYVDRSATGANNGTSWANAWPSFENVVWGDNGVAAGDTLFISGGSSSKVYEAPRFAVGASGKPEAPITLRVGQDLGHNGVVVFDYENLGDTAGIDEAVLCAREWIVFDGEYQGESRWRFANLRNHLSRSKAYAIRGWSADGLVVRFLTFTNCNQGPRFHGTAGAKIHNNVFQQIRGDSAISLWGAPTTWDSSLIYSNFIGLAKSGAVPVGGSGSYSGPDGIQAASGTSIFKNTFRIDINSAISTSTQHPDMLQLSGSHLKIYANEFINTGDAFITMGGALSTNIRDVRIYNNLFRIVDRVSPYPEFIRVYGHAASPISALERFYVMNNTFVDNDTYIGLRFNRWNNNDVVINDIRIQNNLFINCGNGLSGRTIWIEGYPGYAPGDWKFSNNVYWHSSSSRAVVGFRGTDYQAANWVKSVEVDGRTAKPAFARYVSKSEDNDFRLSTADTVAVGNGADLSDFFSTDLDGNHRASWDIGAFAEVGASSSPTADTGIWIEAETGMVTPPYIVSQGSVYQTSETALAEGGRLTLNFQVKEPGEYAVVFLVQAATEASNSVYFSIDSEPLDPQSVWDIPVTAGFQTRTGSWRGAGSFERAEFAPKYFHLEAGLRELVVRGREASVRIDKVMLAKRPAPAAGVLVGQAP